MALSEAGTDDPSALRFREYLEQPCRRELVNEISLLSLFLLLDCQIKWRKWRFMLLLRKRFLKNNTLMLQNNPALRFDQKYLHLCSEEEQNSYGVGTT